jgi:NAD(P)-dependent dehydrogenase (short-subunit alcohol dehydrogenase family)
LDGKVAIVTGGGRGIGRAIAEGYVQEGCRVVVTAAREREEIDSFVPAWGSDRALAFLTGITDYRAREGVINKTISHFGRIDVLYAQPI